MNQARGQRQKRKGCWFILLTWGAAWFVIRPLGRTGWAAVLAWVGLALAPALVPLVLASLLRLIRRWRWLDRQLGRLFKPILLPIAEALERAAERQRAR